MCYPVTCTVCGKTTWSGCGQHVADVRRRVPANQWCNGSHSDAEKAAAKAAASGGGFLGRLFGRG
ncbi:hypothetical protein [Microbacterium sp.]|uniref:hypothetical protein n=1 Tax=Microbacterium sp. TaxID=51671 RepID=UPI00092C391C|nr:hypothetical protein [Microbacterium sp.]MBN9187807.1 hypothetical protein [Microbacterium sp.]MBN9193853.1 hypothetical protein [Microbacterium sp.]OJU70079.1 MAG: hypothetical protein BGO04_05160 [Microbacterium sp. 70-38]